MNEEWWFAHYRRLRRIDDWLQCHAIAEAEREREEKMLEEWYALEYKPRRAWGLWPR